MNIFLLDYDIDTNVQYHCDKHVVKMLLETAQLLCSAFPANTAPYRRTHINHPCAIWARSSLENFGWLCQFGLALSKEYQYRYGKQHKSAQVVQWALDHINDLELEPISNVLDWPQCMPDDCKIHNDAVANYREYYNYKLHNGMDMRYTKRDKPNWLGA